MIRGIQEHLFSALRDIVYTDFKITATQTQPPTSAQATNTVFRILRNARVVRPDQPPKMVVCWGGHSIPREEYDYAKHVGYELGLRGLDIVTGCGIGAMKGPMKGAAVGHAKQQIKDGRYIGISEPGIIAFESPNAIVNELVIMPDIEKRLEAFVRLAHAVIVFPGGVGTVEEILYLLSILMHPDNSEAIPLVFAGPESCRKYFQALEQFLVDCLGRGRKAPLPRHCGRAGRGWPHYQGRRLTRCTRAVAPPSKRTTLTGNCRSRPICSSHLFRPTSGWRRCSCAPIYPSISWPAPCAALFPAWWRAISRRSVLSRCASTAPTNCRVTGSILSSMDRLLQVLVKEKRMKLGEADYQPCYQLVG